MLDGAVNRIDWWRDVRLNLTVDSLFICLSVYSKAFWQGIQVTEDDDFNRKSLRYITWAGSDNKFKKILLVLNENIVKPVHALLDAFDTWKKDASWKKLGSGRF